MQTVSRYELRDKYRDASMNRADTSDTPHDNCVNIDALFLKVITHITRFRLEGIELQWVITQSRAWFRGYDYRGTVLIAMHILIAFPGKPEIR